MYTEHSTALYSDNTRFNNENIIPISYGDMKNIGLLILCTYIDLLVKIHGKSVERTV